MGYLQDYLYYYSENEVPESFNRWSALALLAATLGRKVWLDRGYFIVYPNIYVCLIGTAGSGKSTAKSFAKAIFIKEFPDLLISDSIQSREDIAEKMGSSDCLHTFKDPLTGIINEYRPFFLIVNELANFLSVDTRKMVDFLVDIYDENYFSTGFKNSASQRFINPFVTMLGCVPPQWIMDNLKYDLFSLGLGRRLILVHDEKRKLISDPKPPADGKPVFDRVIKHLQEARKLVGQFTFSKEGKAWWDKWYTDATRIRKDDPIIAQFHETKHVQVLKVAMLLALNERPFRLVYEPKHLKVALAMLDELEPKVIRLTSGIGRNELANISVQLLDTLEHFHGAMSEKLLWKTYFRHLRFDEYKEVLKMLEDTEQIKYAILKEDGIPKTFVVLPEIYKKLREEQEKTQTPLQKI
jgi:hypothetical protein